MFIKFWIVQKIILILSKEWKGSKGVTSASKWRESVLWPSNHPRVPNLELNPPKKITPLCQILTFCPWIKPYLRKQHCRTNQNPYLGWFVLQTKKRSKIFKFLNSRAGPSLSPIYAILLSSCFCRAFNESHPAFVQIVELHGWIKSCLSVLFRTDSFRNQIYSLEQMLQK